LRTHPGLWKWVLAPAVVTLALFVALIVGVLRLIDPVVGWMIAYLPSWLGGTAGSLASTLLTTLVAVALGVGALFVFVAVAGMIAGPFNEMLSEHLEARLTGQPGPPFALGAFLRGFVVGVIHGLRRLFVSLLGLVLVFALGFIPVVGTIAGLLIAGWIAARGAAYDSYDAVLARRAMSYGAKLDYLAGHRQRSLGLGAAVAGMLLVPGVNLVALGLGAAGATLAVLELEAKARVAPARAAGR
jgi:CysZ protein